MKTKTIICTLLVTILIAISANFGVMPTKATGYDRADICLLAAFSLMVDKNIDDVNISRRDIYDFSLNAIGYSYEFEISGQCGFALMIERNGQYEVTELYLNRHSPYTNISGKPVYLTTLSYIEYAQDKFINILNGDIIGSRQIIDLSQRGFGYGDLSYQNGGDVSGTIVKETVTYDRRTVQEDKIISGVPSYLKTGSDMSEACAVQAGAVVLGYYGRYYPELIPGFTVGMQIGNNYIYFNEGSSGIIQGIMNDLYVRMGTNVGGVGTTASGFRNGLTSYVNEKGLNINYTSLATNNILDFDLFKTQINNSKPSVLFFNTYNTIPSPPVRTENNTDFLERKVYQASHIMIAYGYKNYAYYKNEQNFRNDYYLEVYTGMFEYAQGFVKLYDNSVLMEAYGIDIY